MCVCYKIYSVKSIFDGGYGPYFLVGAALESYRLLD